MASVPDLAKSEIAIVEMTNDFRQANKLGTLKANSALEAAARAFAQYLARAGKFAHEADGREPGQRATAAGYHYCLVAENLALNLDSRGFETRGLAQQVVEGWKGSPGHRANMLLAGATEIGVGIAKAPDRDPKYISVEMLGRPEALKVKFSIENRAGKPVGYRLGEKSHELPVRATITHTTCATGELSFEAVAGGPFTPRNEEKFVVRSGEGGSLAVTIGK